MVKQKVGVGNSYGDKGLSDRDGPLSTRGDNVFKMPIQYF